MKKFFYAYACIWFLDWNRKEFQLKSKKNRDDKYNFGDKINNIHEIERKSSTTVTVVCTFTSAELANLNLELTNLRQKKTN